MSLDLRSGRRLWTYGPAGYSGAGLYRDRYYVVGQPLVALDPKTGQVLQTSKREDPVDRPEGGGIDGPIAISETHVFCATSWGPIIAWELTTGRLAGLVKGEGAVGVAPVARYMLIKNGRLYGSPLA